MRQKVWPWMKLVFLVVTPLVLLILPADYFDKGQSLCVSVLLFDMECYACGMTRSIMHLIHLDFMEAFYFNPLGLVVFPLLAWVWARMFLREFRRVFPGVAEKSPQLNS